MSDGELTDMFVIATVHSLNPCVYVSANHLRRLGGRAWEWELQNWIRHQYELKH